MNLSITKIRLDGNTQSRIDINYDVVLDYADAMTNGDIFPPITVFFDGNDYWLADGFHRVEAAKMIGLHEIECDIRPGGQRDALLCAATSNHTHGLRPTDGDKRKAVEILLTDKEWSKWSDGVIAKKCGISQPFVSSIRRDLTQNGFESFERIGADGRTTNTRNIGKRPAATTEVPPNDKLDRISDRVDNGDLAGNTAIRLMYELKNVSPLVYDLCLQYDVSDPDLVPEFERLYKNKSETFATVALTGYLQGSGDSIPLSKATVRDLQAVLEEARRFHVGQAFEAKYPLVLDFSPAHAVKVSEREISLSFNHELFSIADEVDVLVSLRVKVKTERE